MNETQNEVQEQEATQYPAWQAAIRKAQVAENARIAEQNAKWEAEQRERDRKNIENMRQKVEACGLVLSQGDTDKWTIGEYTFHVTETRDYKDMLIVTKRVPGAKFSDFSEVEEGLWTRGYRCDRDEIVYLRNADGADIANAIDRVDASVLEQVERNRIALEQFEAATQAPKADSTPKPVPSLTEQLAALIREIVREEMGVVRDSQFESYL